MCRAGGRRCDTKWDDAHRERYNARRRITRNTAKAQAARANDDGSKASYYDGLVRAAQKAESHHDEAIRAHEAESTDPPGQDTSQGADKCSSCGQWSSNNHDCPSARTLETIRSMTSTWRDSWTQEEDDAFDIYGSVEHDDINVALRDGTELPDNHRQLVEHLDEALARAPLADEPHTLYRGIGFSDARGEPPAAAWVAEHCAEGQEITFDAFTSTSVNRGTAESFSGARSEYTTSGVVFEVETRQAGYTGDSPESEVMLRRGSRFEVVSSGETFEAEGKPFHRVVLREVGTAPLSGGQSPDAPASEPLGSATSAPTAPSWDRRRKYEPRDSRGFADHLEGKHGVTMRMSGGAGSESYVTLSQIEVPKERRGAGVGKAAMKDLVEEADRNGWKLDLTPSGDYGGSVPKLKRFYKAFGFVENKGRNKDYSTRETFLRLPR